MQIFSLRAKNQAEVSRFVEALKRAGVTLSNLTTHRETASQAVEAEFQAAQPLDALQGVALDSSSMLRGTLRAQSREDNSMTYGFGLATA